MKKKKCFRRFYKIVWQHNSVDFYFSLSLLLSSFAFLAPLFSSLLGRFFGSTMFFGLFFQASLTESCSFWNSFKDIFWSWCLHGAFTHKTCIQRTIIIWILLNNLFSQRELNKQAYSWFSHYVTKTQTKKLSHLKTFIQTNFRFKRVLDAWISRLLCDAAFSQECSYVG